MHSLCNLWVIALALWPGCVFGFRHKRGAGQLAEISEVCCFKGTSYAREHTVRDCSSSVPPDVPTEFGIFCKFAMDSCCKEYFEKKRDCDDGIELAITSNSCDSVSNEQGQSCCNHCLRGTTTGKANGICNEGFRAGSAEDMLPADAFEICCKNATKKEEKAVVEHDHVWKKTSPTSSSSVASLCEDYAPNELCAHHCIPVPGSYKCECNPGFQLMADGRNCREVVKNRCKPRNSCQHKCNDNGVEVKCSCRRGYQLQTDGKSCEDIDECRLDPAVCLPGTKCQNIQGSYKCLLEKKSHLDKGQCPPGFTKNLANDACDDINECTLVRPPCPSYLCENTVGGYKCGGVSGDPVNLSTKPPAASTEDPCPPGFKAVRTGVSEECEDVDECEAHKDDCNPQSQFCINIRGSFFCQDHFSKHCPPGFKSNSQTNKCEDINECEESNALCPQDKICVNVAGAYDCKPKIDFSKPIDCPEGMRRKPGNKFCEDIDECLEGTHLCDQYQNCLNTNGSHECRCKLGFELDSTTGACVDVNECATDQNDCIPESQRCDNTIGSYLCVRFISCGTGYTLQHASGKCEDIDECTLGKHNCARAGPSYMCVNIPGSFRCVRKPSSTTTTTAAPEYEYYDSEEEFDSNENELPVNEVKPVDNNVKIEQSTTTTRKPEPTSSSTETIAVLNRTNEAKVEEIQPKPEDSYTIDNKSLEPAEPKTNYPEPSENQEPTETISDVVNQLSISNDNIPVEKTTEDRPTKDTEDVSNKTQIQDKTTPHIVLLEVPNETATVKGVRAEDGSLVINTQDVPKYEWTKVEETPETVNCQIGFDVDEYGACVDIDECATNKHVCSGLTEICRNNMGGYICECATGFRRNLRTGECEMIIRAASSTTTSTTTPVPTTPSSTDRSIYGGYPFYHGPLSRPFRPRTLCDVGFNMNSSTRQCEDINECTNGLSTCADVEVCVNTEGGYRCDCQPNWRYNAIRHRCVPNRDKNKFPPGYANVPGQNHTEVVVGGDRENRFDDPVFTKTDNRGVLQCRKGYKLGDDNSCEDIDECAIGEANCGPEQICTNLRGGYSCSCLLGYRQIGDHQCEDIDECDLAGNTPICSQNADCINTIGSYQCKCHQGFRQAPANDKVCVDVDECVESRSGSLCQHRCNNIWGDYRCSCHRGYRLNPDNQTCSDVDECEEFKSKQLCIGRCLNEPGSYKCSCPKGYRLAQDKRSCIDIDECETGEAFCSSSEDGRSGSHFCFNIRGGYKCEKIFCPNGYRLENRHRCTKIDQVCQYGDWECIHQPSTYSYHYITFVSKLDMPNDRVDLYTMSVPAWPKARTKFQLRLVKADAPPTVKTKADIKSFLLTSTNKNAVVSIIQSLEGPQSLELELSMELYSDENFAGIAVAKLFIYVSEYEF